MVLSWFLTEQILVRKVTTMNLAKFVCYKKEGSFIPRPSSKHRLNCFGSVLDKKPETKRKLKWFLELLLLESKLKVWGDEEDEASNAMFNSPEEIQSLRLLLRKDPNFATSSSWPSLVEWCSTCTSTRMVRLVLPKEENEEPEEEKNVTEWKGEVEEEAGWEDFLLFS